MSTIKLLIG